MSTSTTIDLKIEVLQDLARRHLLEGVDRWLQVLLDKQNGGTHKAHGWFDRELALFELQR